MNTMCRKNELSTESLIRAMYLPIDDVIHTFKMEQEQQQECSKEKSSIQWTTESAQGDFAAIINKIIEPRTNTKVVLKDSSKEGESLIVFEPTVRYIRKLIQRYTSMIEQVSSQQIENEDLVQMMMEYQFKSRKNALFGGMKGGTGGGMNDDNLPNPLESCHVSFIIPNNSSGSSDTMGSTGNNVTDVYAKSDNGNTNSNIVGIKVYPHHNDVGVQRVWEAGAALAEYLIENVHLVKDQHVCELGAGVGLTGLIIAGLCQTKSVHMTDYTNATLENLEYNCTINYDWIIESRKEIRNNNNNIGEEHSSDPNHVVDDDNLIITSVSTRVISFYFIKPTNETLSHTILTYKNVT